VKLDHGGGVEQKYMDAALTDANEEQQMNSNYFDTWQNTLDNSVKAKVDSSE
jgi:hypothetical protein